MDQPKASSLMVGVGFRSDVRGVGGHALCQAVGEGAVEVGVWRELSCLFGLSGLAWPPPPTPFLWAAAGCMSVGGVTCPGGARAQQQAGRGS